MVLGLFGFDITVAGVVNDFHTICHQDLTIKHYKIFWERATFKWKTTNILCAADITLCLGELNIK